MDVKYISADWERMRSALGKVVGAGWGKGTIDELIKMNKNLEKVESDIAKYDSDGVISFYHLDREKTYQGLDEDFNILYQFTNKVGNIVDRTIDQPFYEDMDAFVAEIQGLSIGNQTTKNRIGATTTVHVHGYQSMEVEKQKITMEDLLNGDNFYSKQMKLEYEAWKDANADQEITQEEYQTAALNTRAFGYESIKDGQLNKEFWVNIAAVVVIVGASLICPPAGIALGAAYGTAELTSAVTGKDWVSGRELDTGERVFRGVLAPIDILPAASAFRSFSGVARTSRLGNGVKDLGLNIKTGMKNVETKVVQINDAVVTATQQGSMRIKNANAAVKERVKEIPEKLANKAVDAAKVVDETVANTKTFVGNLNLIPEPSFAGGVVKQSAENTHTVENSVRNIVGRIQGVNIGGSGGARGVEEVNRLIPGTPGKVTGGSSAKLGRNMFEEMGVAKTTKRTPYQAQHIIPKEFKSHPIIQKIGMDMDNATNGFFLRVPADNISATSRHKGYHAVYSNFVRKKLDEINLNQDLPLIEKEVFDLQQKLRVLQEQGLPLYMRDNYLEKELKKIKEMGMEQYKKVRKNSEIETPVWKRGGGATIDLWERWFNK